MVSIALVLAATVAAAGGEPLGSEENPIIWSYVTAGEIWRFAGAEIVAKLLHERTGLFFVTNVAPEYATVIEALSSKPPETHIATLSALAYIIAADRDVADAGLVFVRFSSAFFNAQIMLTASRI